MTAAMGVHPLDYPVWNMLNGPQRALAQTLGSVCRIDPAFGPFAAAAATCEPALAGLLCDDGDEIWILDTAELSPPSGTRIVRRAALLQMIADSALQNFPEDAELSEDGELVVLTEDDARDMTALAHATQPGPWGPSTHRYGTFYGVRREGRVVAMAGERMRPSAGLAEVSAVCTYPEFRGQGLAARLIRRVMAGFAARGDTPFLHSYAGNVGAIRLYESLGFRARREMVVSVLAKA